MFVELREKIFEYLWNITRQPGKPELHGDELQIELKASTLSKQYL